MELYWSIGHQPDRDRKLRFTGWEAFVGVHATWPLWGSQGLAWACAASSLNQLVITMFSGGLSAGQILIGRKLSTLSEFTNGAAMAGILSDWLHHCHCYHCTTVTTVTTVTNSLCYQRRITVTHETGDGCSSNANCGDGVIARYAWETFSQNSNWFSKETLKFTIRARNHKNYTAIGGWYLRAEMGVVVTIAKRTIVRFKPILNSQCHSLRCVSWERCHSRVASSPRFRSNSACVQCQWQYLCFCRDSRSMYV
jgi:hypothetical protein